MSFGKAGTGTHFDSAGHIIPGGRLVHQYPPHELIAPLLILPLPTQPSHPDNPLTPQHIVNFERLHGRIPPHCIVLIDSGWSSRWPHAEAVLNMDAGGVRRFPGVGGEAARMLVERGVRGVCVDTMSLDVGGDATFEAHRVLLGADLFGVENVRVVEGMPAVGATIVVAPLLLQGGSESPSRVYAFV